MGQTASSGTGTTGNVLQFESQRDLLGYFAARATKQFTTPELVAFKSNLKGKGQNDKVSVEEMLRLLKIPLGNELLADLLYNCIKTLSNFPLIRESYDDITVAGLLKSCILLNHDRCIKYVGFKNYDQLKLIYIALALRKTVKELPSSPDPAKPWDAKSIIRNYNSVDIDDLYVPADSMLQLLTLSLVLSRHCTVNNAKIQESAFQHWDDYKANAMNLLRTMNPDIVNTQDTVQCVISFEQFSNAIAAVFPQVLKPLEILVEHMLYLDRDLTDELNSTPMPSTSKLVTEPLLAQLSTMLPKELVYSKLRKLYVGRESGFSMRSFQSKAFKWMAPSILLIGGMRITDDQEYATTKNPRYKKFLEEYPKLKDKDQHIIDPCSLNRRKLLFAVYINEPWKVTNKELFGDLKTTVVQLSPKQELFKAVRTGNVYFNTLGGGIGVGCAQPVIKPNGKKYFPGNVSLTIDSSLEFASFRHVGYGGAISPGTLMTKLEEEKTTFEYKFIVQDVEVWGCGGEKELQEQIKQWEWEEAEAKRRQRINLQSIGEDRALLEMAGLVGQHQSGGSM